MSQGNQQVDQMKKPQAAILAIGDELVLGQTVDTNSAWLSQQLVAHGLPTLIHQTVADDLQAICDMFAYAAKRVDLILITGGLGPTQDDMTRQGLAEAIGDELVEDTSQLARLQAFFEKRGRPMSPNNRVQLLYPSSGRMIDNDHGTAPGIYAKIGQTRVYAMPGVPREMRGMFTEQILPELKALSGDEMLFTGDVMLTTKLNTFGLGESNVGELMTDLMTRDRNPTVGTTVSQGVVSIRVRSCFSSQAQAHEAQEKTLAELRSRLGALVYSQDEISLAEVLVPLLAQQNKTVATAESCTGGLIGKMITDVPGSSEVYAGGWVTYHNDMKTAGLGVEPELIEKHGAVSEEVVRAMALGALKQSGSDYAVSVSGVAGPGGGTEDKPVGTVWLGLAQRVEGQEDQTQKVKVQAIHLHLPGGRTVVRDRAAKCALQVIRLALLNEPLSRIAWIKNTI